MSDLAAALPRQGVADADDSSLVRAMYATDASLYRVVPSAVVRPRHVDEIVATLAVAREHSVPVTMRGAGTSIAGNAVGTGAPGWSSAADRRSVPVTTVLTMRVVGVPDSNRGAAGTERRDSMPISPGDSSPFTSGCT